MRMALESFSKAVNEEFAAKSVADAEEDAPGQLKRDLQGIPGF